MVVEAGVGKMGHVNLNIMAIGFSKADTGTSFGAELEVAAKGVRGDFIVGKHESAETPRHIRPPRAFPPEIHNGSARNAASPDSIVIPFPIDAGSFD